jgi:hypothetical protein
MSVERLSILVGQLSDFNMRIGLSVAVGTVLFGLLGFAADSTMTSLRIPDDIHAGMVGAIVGLGAGLAFWLLLAGLRERRIFLADEIHRLAELNHTVRNSLNLITLAHHSADEAHKKLILESTAHIDEKLRELFPVVGSPDKWRKKSQISP